jgi:hypothetical protein
MIFFFFLYMSTVFWFFAWVIPRVNDGTIAIFYDKLRGLAYERLSLWRSGYNFRKWQIKKYTKRLIK